MPQLTVSATELQNVSVDFVSLVHKGANRLPFKIIKSEGEVSLDVSKIGKALFIKSEAGVVSVAPIKQVEAILVPESANAEAILAEVTKASPDIQLAIKKEAGFISLAKSDTVADDSVVLRTGNNGAIIVSGLKKVFDAYTGVTGFTNKVRAEGFYGSLWNANYILEDCIYEALNEAGSPQEATSLVTAIVGEYQAYVTMLLSELPTEAFYIDRFMSASVSSALMGCCSYEGDDGLEVTVTIDKSESGGEELPEPVEGDSKSEGVPVPEVPAEPVVDPVLTPAKVDEYPDLVKALGDSLSSAILELKSSLGAEVISLASKLEALSTKVDKTSTALNGTVFADPVSDKQRKKGNGSSPTFIPVEDAAYTRGRL